jgi:hypothetical protein
MGTIEPVRCNICDHYIPWQGETCFACRQEMAKESLARMRQFLQPKQRERTRQVLKERSGRR